MPKLTDRERLRALSMAAAESLGIDPDAFAEDIDEIMQDILYYIRSGQGDAVDAALHVARQRGVTL